MRDAILSVAESIRPPMHGLAEVLAEGLRRRRRGRLGVASAVVAILAVVGLGWGFLHTTEQRHSPVHGLYPPGSLFDSEGLSFRYPGGWHAAQFEFRSSFFHPIVYLSNEQLHPPCRFGHQGQESICGRPLDRLSASGVLATWSSNGSPSWRLSDQPGGALTVGGLPAVLDLQAGNRRCSGLGADTAIDVQIERDVPHNWYELEVCSRGIPQTRVLSATRLILRTVDFGS